MIRSVLLVLAFAATLGFAAVLVSGGAQSETRSTPNQPVVVELFTSQGCSSCPPADAFLTELAQDPNIIALSLHVDYWDYIGWPDPFADPKMTARQRDYEQTLASRYIYTPQMVIDGVSDVVGSRRREAQQAIADASAKPKPLVLRYEEDGGDKVVIPAGNAPAEGATVWLAVYDFAHETEVLRGENRGKTLRYSNVVRELEQIGTWNGEETVIPLDMAGAEARGRDGCAVIVQTGKGGAVLGAIAMDLNR